MPSPDFFCSAAALSFREIAVGSDVPGGLYQIKANSIATFFAHRELVAFNSKHFMRQAMLIVHGSVDPGCEYVFPRFEPIRHGFSPRWGTQEILEVRQKRINAAGSAFHQLLPPAAKALLNLNPGSLA
jgi:hypothetical protein